MELQNLNGQDNQCNASVTPTNITSLSNNEIFVFGSNTAGRHGAGAAKTAEKLFGAIYGQGAGLQGQSYAIPTLDDHLNKLDIDFIQNEVNIFESFVISHPDLHFLITPIGTGLAGFSIEEIAILFAGFQDFKNVSLPKEFIDILGTKVVYGFKAMKLEFNEDGILIRRHCREFDYKIGKSYIINSPIDICNNGYHFCENILDTLNYYNKSKFVGYCKVLGCGSIQKEHDKVCVSIIKIKSEFNTDDTTWNSGNWNSGNRNSGDRNSGNSNSGNWNSGNWNSGNSNSGDRNSGDRNSGNSNSGNRNSGNRNSGNWNSGNWNSGNWNSGNRNSGNWNSGDRNSGNWNSGNWNSGDLNTINAPYIIFNKISSIPKSDMYFPNWLNFKTVYFKNSDELTEQEKIDYPYYNICGGALIKLDYKLAAQESYNKATKEEQRSIEDLPNYDPEILFEIFGIDRRKYKN